MKRMFERLKISVGQTYYAVTPVIRFITNCIPIPLPNEPLAAYTKS